MKKCIRKLENVVRKKCTEEIDGGSRKNTCLQGYKRLKSDRDKVVEARED